MTETYLIRGARVNGEDATDLIVADGVIAEAGASLSRAASTAPAATAATRPLAPRCSAGRDSSTARLASVCRS